MLIFKKKVRKIIFFKIFLIKLLLRNEYNVEVFDALTQHDTIFCKIG